MTNRFRKKPVVIEAMQWDGGLTSIMEIDDWLGQPALADRIVNWKASEESGVHDVVVQTLEGAMAVAPGDWIIMGVHGELYPCKPNIFEQTYEAPDPR